MGGGVSRGGELDLLTASNLNPPLHSLPPPQGGRIVMAHRLAAWEAGVDHGGRSQWGPLRAGHLTVLLLCSYFCFVPPPPFVFVHFGFIFLPPHPKNVL